MTTSTIPHPPIVSRDQWLAERMRLLTHEKELTKQCDRVNAERRRLPMVKIEKNYVFDGRMANKISKTSSTDGVNSLSTTSCSTPSGRRAAQVARAM